MNNDRILRTLQQDVEIPEVVRKKADQAFAGFMQNRRKRNRITGKWFRIIRKKQKEKLFPKGKLQLWQQLQHWLPQP